MAAQTTYPVFLASPRRDSFVPQSSSARGIVAWSQRLDLEPEEPPLHLLCWGDRVVVVSPDRVDVYDLDGALLWKRERMAGALVPVRGDRLFLLNTDGDLEILDPDGASVVDSSWVPMADEPTFPSSVALLWPLPAREGAEDEFLLAAQIPGAGANVPPVVTCYRNAVGANFGVWEHDVIGRLRLPPLYVPGIDRMLLATTKVNPINCGDGARGEPFSIPISDPVNWCADDQGNLFVIGTHEPEDTEAKVRGVLLALGPDGAERWRWSGSPGMVAWHPARPPVVGANGVVFGLVASAVLAFEGGDLAWDYKISATAATALGDGTLLLTAGSSLVRLDDAGERMFAANAGGPILTPPVVDGQGSIYLATDKQLVKIQ